MASPRSPRRSTPGKGPGKGNQSGAGDAASAPPALLASRARHITLQDTFLRDGLATSL